MLNLYVYMNVVPRIFISDKNSIKCNGFKIIF
jgi:hypothetical protein